LKCGSYEWMRLCRQQWFRRGKMLCEEESTLTYVLMWLQNLVSYVGIFVKVSAEKYSISLG